MSLAEAALISDWLIFFQIPVWQEPRKHLGWGKARGPSQVRTRVEVHSEQESPVLADPPVPEVETAPTQSELERSGGGREVGKGGEVARVIANLRVGPDGCRGWAIYVRWGGASQEEAPTDHGRHGSPEGIPLGWKSEEALKVLTRDSGSL